MQTECLNIKENICRIIKIAIKQEKTIEGASKVLGVSSRTVYNMIKKFNLTLHEDTQKPSV